MNDELDPQRLSESSDDALERRLAGLVAISRHDVGTPEQLAKLEAALLPLIGPSGPTPPSPSPPAHPAGGPASVGATAGAKAAAIAVAVVAAAGAGLWIHSTPSQPVEQRTHMSPTPPQVPALSVTPSVVPEIPSEEPGIAPAQEERPAAPVAPSNTLNKPAISEPELVGEAQAALSRNPARALALCEKHRKLFPHGVLVQEREVLAIEALDKLGRHAQAVDRGDRFLKAFPSSAHRSKIVGIIGPR